MELWDAYTRDGVKTGETLVRDEQIPKGRYHLVCEVLVRHVDGEYLCMIRSRQKPNYPLYPECTAGGSALKGEDVLACARRELLEETGYEAAEMKFLFHGPSSPGLTSESLSFYLATGLRRVAAGGGVENENITVREAPLDDIDAWLAARVEQGIALDPRIYTGLYFLKCQSPV